MPNMELIIGLLAAATLLTALARAIDVPYPIVLVIGGAVLAAVPGVPEVTVAPNLVFLVFLPPLLYAGGLFSSPRELRDSAGPITLLAVGLVLATVLAVAAVAHAVAGIPWPEAFVLGGVLGATDPIAATAIIRRFGAPQRIATLLEGEALINDGTSLTAFKVSLAASTSASFSFTHGLLEFVAVGVGGAAIGAVVGWVSAELRRRIDDANLEIVTGILTGYAAYIVADRVGASGVLAAVAAGLLTAGRSSEIFSPGTRLRSYAFWQVTEFILNALLFLLVGLQLRAALSGIRGSDTAQLALNAVAVIASVLVVRIAWMYLIPTLVPAVRRRLPEERVRSAWREQIVLGWSGMRGALSIAAALSLPLSLGGDRTGSERATIVFLAFAATFATLVLPGLTLGPLIRRLGLGHSEEQVREALDARLRMVGAALARLDEIAQRGDASEETVGRLRDIYALREGALQEDLGDGERLQRRDLLREERRVVDELVRAQRDALRRMSARREAPADLLRDLERELDFDASQRG